MSPRVINPLMVLLAVALLGAVWLQQRRLGGLRDEKQELLALLAGDAAPADSQGTASITAPASSELLRLRSEVAQLTARRKELAAARTENERLQARIAERVRNPAAALPE